MSNPDGAPLIVAFVADLYFSVRIEDAARRLDFGVRLVESADEIAPLDPDVPRHQLGEHLVGRGAVLLDDLTRWKPALIIFDLNNQAVPWQEWIRLITSVPATRRIPVMCFGSHRDVGAMQAAKKAGAAVVLARSQFVSQLPALIEKYARRVDEAALEETCGQPLSQKAIRGLEQFNHGQYFEAHEYLEAAWNEDESLGRDLYRAVLQVAVAYYHILHGNYKGAAKVFLRLRQWIDPLPDTCRGVQVARLRDEARHAYQELKALGPERISEFDRSLLKPVQYRAPQ
jgi:predicted metal-dependent hydrolase